MSLHEYLVSQEIGKQHYPFYALIMAAMRQADTDNAFRLRCMFPEIWDELQERYNAPRGVLEEERSNQICGNCDMTHLVSALFPAEVYYCELCAKRVPKNQTGCPSWGEDKSRGESI